MGYHKVVHWPGLSFAYRRALQILCLILILFVHGCSKNGMQLDNLFSTTTVNLQNTFAQLVDEEGTETAAHYVTVKFSNENFALLTPSTGLVKYMASIDSLGECLILTPKPRSKGMDLSVLDTQLSDVAASVKLAFCNMNIPAAGTGMGIVLDNELKCSEIGNSDKQAECETKADEALLSFLYEGSSIGVWAEPEVTRRNRVWSEIGPAIAGILQIAAYTWKDSDGDEVEEDGERIYINPMPYLSAISLPSSVTDNVRSPELAQVYAEYSADDTFTTVGNVELLKSDGTLVTDNILSGHTHFYFRLKNNTDNAANSLPVTAPYEISYTLKQIDGSSNPVRAAGTYHMNTLSEGALDTIKLTQKDNLYRGSPATSEISVINTGDHAQDEIWMYVPFDTNNWVNTSTIDLTAQDTSSNVIDLGVEDSGVPVFPDGAYELELSISNIFTQQNPSTIALQFSIGDAVLEFKEDTVTTVWSSGGTYNAKDNLTATSSAADSQVTWSIEGLPGASIDNSGVVTFGSGAGTYTVTVEHNTYGNQMDSFTLNVVSLDLEIDGVVETDEEAIGRYLALNGDDNDGDGTADKDQVGPVVGEDDLVPLNLTFGGSESGTVTLAVTGGADKIALWLDEQKIMPANTLSWTLGTDTVPATIYVEGTNISTPQEVEIKLSYTDGAVSYEDVVNATVLTLEFMPDHEFVIWESGSSFDIKQFLTPESVHDDTQVTWAIVSGAPAAAISNAGVFNYGSGGGSYVVTVTHNQSSSISAQFVLNVLWVDKVEWVTKNSVLDANPNTGGGQRIYPGKQTPRDATNRDEVTVKATVIPTFQNIAVHFKNFDVDDPYTDAAPIDVNMGMGSDNRGAGGAALSAASAVTNAAGEAEVELTVTMQPGDNFRVGAHLVQADLSAVTDNDVPANNNGTVAGQPGKYTELLTVWRKLHIELDSMKAVTGNSISGHFTDIVGSGIALTELRDSSVGLDDESKDFDDPGNHNGRFENGTVTLGTPPNTMAISPLAGNGYDYISFAASSIAGLPFSAIDNDFFGNATMSGEITDVTGNAGNYTWTLNVTTTNENPIDWNDYIGGTFEVGGGNIVVITGANGGTNQLTTSALDIPFKIVDDDVANMPTVVAIPGLVEDAFTEAYISAVNDGGGSLINNSSNVPFILNLQHSDGGLRGAMQADSNTDRSPDYWIAYVLLAYQSTKPWPNDNNNDPDNERSPGGGTPRLSPKTGSVIYIEHQYDVHREHAFAPSVDTNIRRSVAHEIGHQFCLHDVADIAGGIPYIMGTMGNGATDFSDAHIEKIRLKTSSPSVCP